MSIEVIGKYRNGNYNVTILSDGTKIRETEDDNFISDFPENIDIKITNFCDMNCPMCHENSTVNGKHGDILNADFINTLHPYTELAIGGGNPLAHPDLIPFLEKLCERNIIPNLTVNQRHFEKDQQLIRKLVDDKLIYGIGISLVSATSDFVNLVKQYDNAVIHTINGILTANQVDILKNNNLKILILGYKTFRRGADFFNTASNTIINNQRWLDNALPEIVNQFDAVSFDNLAIEQLNVKQLMSEEEWNEFYMGDDGQYTMYIDMVNRKFAKNSIAETRYDLLDNIDDMFAIVKQER